MELPKRKTVRLKGYDYNAPGYYFITLCTKEKQKLLCDIVGTGVLDGPKTDLTPYGITARKQIEIMKNFYPFVSVEKYVIMPNHIHFLFQVKESKNSGPSGTPVPTNSAISQFVSTFKRFTNKEYGKNIWQYRSNDHIIRGDKDYLKIYEYIENNPAKWHEDCFYVG